MDVVQHAIIGAVVAGGGLTAVQGVLSRRLRHPSSLALSLGSFVGVFRLLEGAGRKLSARNGPQSAVFSASQAAAVAAAVALLLVEAERKTIVVSYAVVEAALTLVQEYTSLAETKYIGTR
jgi:hypothetical protein